MTWLWSGAWLASVILVWLAGVYIGSDVYRRDFRRRLLLEGLYDAHEEGVEHVYGLVLAERSKGFIGHWKYIHLRDLEDEGYVESHVESIENAICAQTSRIPRRLYRLTSKGHRWIEAHEKLISIEFERQKRKNNNG